MKMKKAISFILAMVMILSNSILVYANNDENDGTYVGGVYLSSEAVSYLEENGIQVEAATMVEFITSVETQRSIPVTAFRVVQKDGEEVTESIVVAYEENDEGDVTATDVPLTMQKARTTSTVTWNPNSSGLISISSTITYTASGDIFTVYIKPSKVSFSYTKKKSCTVNSIAASYQTEGILCDSSGNQLQSDYIHYIEKSVSSPTSGTTYSKSNSLTSGRKIEYIASSSGGMWLTLNSSINSKKDAHTFAMNPVN